MAQNPIHERRLAEIPRASFGAFTPNALRLVSGLNSRFRIGRKCEGKAGGYAIQGRAEVFVKRINGSYSNVVGLPLAETVALLRGLGYAC